MMITLKEVYNIILDEKYDHYYELYNGSEIIGTAAIREKSNNMLYINILNKYRGNTFGAQVFQVLIAKFKDIGITEISIIIDNDNIQMLRIINHQKHKVIANGTNFKQYLVSIQ